MLQTRTCVPIVCHKLALSKTCNLRLPKTQLLTEMKASDYMWQAHMQAIWKEAHRAIVGASSNLTITTRTPAVEQNASYATQPNPKIGSCVEIDDCTGKGITQRLQTYQSTAVTSPVWPSRTTGASEGWSTWTRESLTLVAVVNAKFLSNPWHSNWPHKILDTVAAHYCISFLDRTRTKNMETTNLPNVHVAVCRSTHNVCTIRTKRRLQHAKKQVVSMYVHVQLPSQEKWQIASDLTSEN